MRNWRSTPARESSAAAAGRRPSTSPRCAAPWIATSPAPGPNWPESSTCSARSSRRRRRRQPRRARAGAARAAVNSKAKQRAWSAASGSSPPAEPPPAIEDSPPALSPLTSPSGRLLFEAGPSDVDERLDRFLGRAAADRRFALSRTRLKALIEAGHVKVDGNIVIDAAYRVSEGAQIEVEAPPAIESRMPAQELPLDIVFEDSHLLVLDKPAGLVVHPAAGHEDGTLVNALIAHCGDSLSGIGGVRRPGIVHRLDKDTSGLLVVAKTDAAHRGLAGLFADHGRVGSLVREYQALAWGAFDAKTGTIDAPLGRHPRLREKMAIVEAERGRFAVTHWRV